MLSPFVTYMRGKGQAWRVIASGRTYRACEAAAAEWLRQADELPAGVETFTGKRDSEPPHVREL
jgi:hypothetical protein